MAITGPKEYYEKMGIWGVDQMIYTVALFGMVAGLAGTIKSGVIPLIRSEPVTILPFLALGVGSTWAAATGLKQANDSN